MRRSVARCSAWLAASLATFIGFSASAQQFPERPPPASDQLFVVDQDLPGVGLDEPCSFDDVIIRVPVDRYVGAVDADGFLLNAAQLVANGVISPMAKVRLPCFDIDFPSELDEIYINGRRIESAPGVPVYLQGSNNVYNLNELEFPVEWLRFPAFPSSGSSPATVLNEIRIDVDTGPGGPGNWCMSVDWATIQIKAMAPVFLVHGVLSTGNNCWNSACVGQPFVAPFTDPSSSLFGTPFTFDIDLGLASSFETNAVSLAKQVKDRAAQFGVQSIHIVAHSKGGLDTRAFLCNQTLYTPGRNGCPKVLSLSTIASPHLGSAAADWLAGQVYIPPLPALTSLTTQKCALLELETEGRFPQSIRVFSYGADADLNGDRTLDSSEAECLNFLFFSPQNFHQRVGTTGYSIVSVQIAPDYNRVEVEQVPATTFNRNDSVVAQFSALFPDRTALDGFYLGRNHTTVHFAPTTPIIIGNIRTAFPIQN